MDQLLVLLTGMLTAVMAFLRKLVLLIPLILLLPHFLSNQVFAVFIAEPISDFLAASVTTAFFFLRFNKILAGGPKNRNQI